MIDLKKCGFATRQIHAGKHIRKIDLQVLHTDLSDIDLLVCFRRTGRTPLRRAGGRIHLHPPLKPDSKRCGREGRSAGVR